MALIRGELDPVLCLIGIEFDAIALFVHDSRLYLIPDRPGLLVKSIRSIDIWYHGLVGWKVSVTPPFRVWA